MGSMQKGGCGSSGFKEAGIHRILTTAWRKTLEGSRSFAGICFLLLFVFPCLCIADDVTLAWDENAEPNIAGYRIYYRTGSSGSRVLSRYNGTGIENGRSPINFPVYDDANLDPRFCEITLRGLDEDRNYYFVVTAYNHEGLESAPSNEASLARAVAATDSPTESSSPTGSASVESGSFGGGGGCFISVLWK